MKVAQAHLVVLAGDEARSVMSPTAVAKRLPDQGDAWLLHEPDCSAIESLQRGLKLELPEQTGVLNWQRAEGLPALDPIEAIQSAPLCLSATAIATLKQAPASSWQEQLTRWQDAGLQGFALNSGHPGLLRHTDAPTLLHLSHSWGGGIARWIEDFCTALPAVKHLLLRSRRPHDAGDRTPVGIDLELVLREDRQDHFLVQWPLRPAIDSTALQHAEYTRILDDICTRCGVDRLIVSSLIGHSLDALRAPRPDALIVMHDLYPACSALHGYFKEACDSCEPERLARCLAHNPFQALFAPRAVNDWRALRQQWAELSADPRHVRIAPSQSVAEQADAICSGFAAKGVRCIPHGIRRDSLQGLSAGDHVRPRLLVLGRLQAAKGAARLRQIIDGLGGEIDIWLLGCGIPALPDFLGLDRVNVIANYRHEELAGLLAHIRPDLALVPSLVPESFCYTYSELSAAAIPALAADQGALGERISDGRSGFLIPASAGAHDWLERIRALLANTEALANVRTHLRESAVRELADMAADYAELLPQQSEHTARLDYEPLQALADYHAEQSQRLVAELADSAATIARQQKEIITRGNWARRLDDDKALLEAEFQQRTAWALDLDAEIAGLRTQQALEQREARMRQRRLEDAEAELAQRRSDHLVMLGERDRHLARLKELEQERQRVLNSYSWRITRPLRGGIRALLAIKRRGQERMNSIRTHWRRTRQSLRNRGWRATMQRIAQELRRRRERPAQPLSQAPQPGTPLSELKPLRFPGAEQARFSIIIPVYNQRHHTYACLASLIAADDHLDECEVIVVDDASSDDTAQMLSELVSGVRVVTQDPNQGFIAACNAGLAAASGHYVVLLNNDTEVQPRWLSAMAGSFADFPDCGLVGAKLVYADGRLQEAGGIVFSNGNAWNYGRDENAQAAEYNFAREVDYCSGACLMIERELFEQLHGFDAHYAPAYYEDTDLAFRVRELGKQVIYQPLATVIHFEGVSSGTDETSGTKRYQVINRDKFLQRWQHRLGAQPLALEDHQPVPDLADFKVHQAANFRHAKTVLVVDAVTPMPDHDSGSLRMWGLLQLLRERGYHVVFLPHNRAYDERYSTRLMRAGIEVLHHEAAPDITAWLRRRGEDIVATVLSRHYVASDWLPLVQEHCPNSKLIFDTVDLHYLREQREAELSGADADAKRAAQTRAQELAVMAACDLTLVVSPVEIEVLAKDAPGVQTAVLSNIHELAGRAKDFAERRDLMFVGGFQHPPNIDAVEWFVAEVMPLIRARRDGIRVHIIGSRAPKRITELAGEDVLVHGFVRDIEPYFNETRVAIAPLRYGAGVKGKVNSSMSHGQPVVATGVAAEGMFLRDGQDILIGDTPAEFADAVLKLYGDEALWQRLSDAGLNNVQRYFSVDAARLKLDEAWQKLGLDSQP